MAGLRFDLRFDWRLLPLANGLLLITIRRPGSPTVAVRAYVRAGSRYDAEVVPGPQFGLAHGTEHLLFKGTTTHSQRELFAGVERLGGVLEAGTAKEYVTLHTVTPWQGLVPALDILAGLLCRPALREEDFWKEKLVLLEELRRGQDQHNVIFDLFAQTLWRRHPLRHPAQGTLQGLHTLDYASLLSFHRQHYVSGNMLLVVAGDIDHEKTSRLVADRFGGLPSGPEQLPTAAHEPPISAPRTAHLDKDLNQYHLLVGVPTVSMKHGDRSSLKVLERVLGMGGSARLYQRLREQAQLVYSVRTLTAHYEDAGYFAVHTACDPAHAHQVQQIILQEWERLCDKGVSGDELISAKSNYGGTLARRFETNLAVAGIFGVEGLLHRVEPFQEAVQRIDAVQRDDVQRVARQYLQPQRLVRVSIGREPPSAQP